MQTNIKTVHEEGYSDGSITFGVLLNHNNDFSFKESHIYIFNHKDNMYIFFQTIISMLEYKLYGERKIKRAYMEEEIFDSYWDAPYIDGKFGDLLIWLNE